MKTTLSLLFSFSFVLILVAQNNALVIQNNAFLVVNGGTVGNEAVVVINQSNPNGIITSGTGGNIITQGEFDYIKWNVQTGSGNYVVPFTTDVGFSKIPLQINITSAGTGSGYLALSSWDVSTGAGSFNNMPYPSEVTHMAGANGQADVSEYAVDRFWIMDVNDPLGTGETFGTEPIATYNFGYNTAAAETADGNILAVGNLGAQRYDGATNKWHGWFSGTPAVANAIWGTDNAAGNVSGIAPAGPWFRTWTLADISEPLPVTMTSMDAECEETGVVLSWETSSELNNDHFEIYKSFDGIDYNLLAMVPSEGNANTITQYEFTDELGSSFTLFYKVAQIDNGQIARYYDPIKMDPCFTENVFNAYSVTEGEIIIDITSEFDENFNVVIYDAIGKQIDAMKVISSVEGPNKFYLEYPNLSFGNYLVTLQNETKTFTKKLILK